LAKATLTVSFRASIGKGLCNHLYERSFIYAYILSAQTLYLMAILLPKIMLFYPVFVATEDLTLAYLVIFPQFSFTSSATQDKQLFIILSS